MAVVLGALVGVLTRKLGDLAEKNIGQVLGVKKELNTLQNNMQWIETIIQDPKRRRNGVSKLYGDELTDWMFDAEDVIELCGMHGSELLEDRYQPSLSLAVCNPSMAFSCFGSLPFRHKIGTKIKDLNARLDQITKNKNRFIGEGSKLESKPSRVIDRETTPLIALDNFVGSEIENDSKELINLITKQNKEQILVIAICGMGGIGKSTLAKKLYNDSQIIDTFEKKSWVFVSPNYTNIDVLKRTIENVSGRRPESDNKTNLQNILVSTIEGKSFFLVLDDVWNADIWENALKAPFDKTKRGVVLVTTRDGNIAKRMRAHIKQVEPLSSNSSWELLSKSAYLDENEVESLKDIGYKIVGKCGGLPLAIKVIGGVLCEKERTNREWQRVLDRDTWMKGKECEGALLLSYEDLSPPLQQCFLYSSTWLEGTMWQRYLVMYWVAEGFIQSQGDMIMEEIAEDYYHNLIRRNMLQSCRKRADGPEQCTMHDLLRSLAHSLSQSQSLFCDAQKLLTTDISKLRRLSINDGGESVTIPTPNDEKLRLRTLSCFNTQKVEFHLFERLESLRVLSLNDKGVEYIPESLEKLKLLRVLDLDRTRIRDLPESIRSLVNLEILNLQSCRCLKSLPKGLTKLYNLRRLNIYGTALEYVPKGIGSLKQLNDLQGFIAASSSSMEHENNGWDLKELEAFSNLRYLLVENLERQVCDVQVLKEKSHLKELHLYCKQINSKRPFMEEEFYNVEKTFEHMCPSSCLEKLYMRYTGRQFPKWIEDLSHLTFLSLEDCINCLILPPVGQLPNLKWLLIKNAHGVASIGSEFLGNGAVAFPKLEFIRINTMPNWEIWSLATERIEHRDVAQEGDAGTSCSLSMFPRLKDLFFLECPKLIALPEGLNQATSLKGLTIHGAASLKAVENLQSISVLYVINCPSLAKVSNLYQLKKLYISGCPILRCIENMNCLQLLNLQDPDMKSLPKGMSEIANPQQNLDDANTRLVLYCSPELLMRCLKGGEDWLTIQQFSSASIGARYEDTWIFIEYNRLTEAYKTNYWDFFPSDL